MYSDLMGQILEAAPGFRGTWDDFLHRWGDEAPHMSYLAMGELAHYLVESYEAGHTGEFAALFELVEKQFQVDDRELHGLIQLGLFEDLQNIASHRDFSYQVFRQWLGPRSLTEWDSIDQAMREVARWVEAKNRRRWWQFWRPRVHSMSAQELAGIKDPQLRRIAKAGYRRFDDEA